MDAEPDAFPTFDRRLAEALTGRDGEPGVGLDEGLPGYLGMRITHAGPGVAVVEVELRDELVHRFGAAHNDDSVSFWRLSLPYSALRADRTVLGPPAPRAVRGSGTRRHGRGVMSGGASR
jgi:hypothetical protein